MNKKLVLTVFTLIILVTSIWAIPLYLLESSPNTIKYAQKQEFVNIYTSLGALFSGLAFSGLLVTIYLQAKQMKSQQEETEKNSKEIAKQNERLQQQENNLNQQRFENTFFELLKTFNSIVYSIEINFNNSQIRGKDVFQILYKDFADNIKSNSSQKNVTEENKSLEEAFVKTFAQHQSNIGYYFHNLYSVIHFVDQAKGINNKDFYIELILSQMTGYEYLFLFYYCLSSLGRPRFGALVEHYKILKFTPEEMLIKPEHAKLFKNLKLQKR